MDEETLSGNEKVFQLTEKEYTDIWFDMQWPEDKKEILERKKQFNGLVKWVGI